MKLNEIKKALYKEKPVAQRLLIGTKETTYCTRLNNDVIIGFAVPADEITESFTEKMSAQLLIRWIIKHKD